METVSVGVASLPEVKVSTAVCKIQPNKEVLYSTLPSVLKDKKYLKKFPLRCLLGRKLKF